MLVWLLYGLFLFGYWLHMSERKHFIRGQIWLTRSGYIRMVAGTQGSNPFPISSINHRGKLQLHTNTGHTYYFLDEMGNPSVDTKHDLVKYLGMASVIEAGIPFRKYLRNDQTKEETE